MAHSLLKCTNAECSRTDVCDCFPCTNDAQSLLCDLCYRCLGSFSITDKRLDLCLEIFKSVSLSLSVSLWHFKVDLHPVSQQWFDGFPRSHWLFSVVTSLTGEQGEEGREGRGEEGGVSTVSTSTTTHDPGGASDNRFKTHQFTQ